MFVGIFYDDEKCKPPHEFTFAGICKLICKYGVRIYKYMYGRTYAVHRTVNVVIYVALMHAQSWIHDNKSSNCHYVKISRTSTIW